jgi:transposase
VNTGPAENHDDSSSAPRAADESIVCALVKALREIENLASERDHYKKLAELFKRELDRINDLQKTPREHVDPNQVQLAFAQLAKEILEKIAANQGPQPVDGATDGTSGGNPNGKKASTRDSHGRSVLPEHLPVRTLVLTPAGIAADAVVIDHEVSWRLGFQRGGFHRLKVLRPVFSVPISSSVDVSVVNGVLHEGELSRAPAAAAATDAETAPVAMVATSVDAPDCEARCAEGAENSCGIEGDVASGAEGPGKDESASMAVLSMLVAARAAGLRTPVEATVHALEGAAGECDAPEEEVRISGSTATTKLVCAELPAEMIPRGLPTSDLLAHVITQKFADKNPFNRQEGIYARENVRIPRANMCRWAELLHPSCKRVVDAMCAEALATAPYICTDATGILVQANERCKRGHFWVFVAGREHVFFRYSKTHSQKEPLSFFKGYGGTVIADACNVYDALFRDPDGPDEAGCNAHARRYFYKALGSDKPRALVGIGFYNALFALEREWLKLPPSKRLSMRQERCAPLMEKLRAWRDEELGKDAVADGTPIRRALLYTRNHWDPLTRFLKDGRIPAHNNWSELELRRLVIGRANWLFVGSDESAEWTCTFVSLIASCALHKLDPEAYLGDLFRVLPSWPQTRMLELAPRYWAATRARLDPLQLAVPFGPITVPAVPLAFGQESPK